MAEAAGIVSEVFNLAGGVAKDLFGAKGAKLSAASYRDAAGIAEQNANIERESTGLQTLMTERQLYKTIGSQRAGIANAGFAESGTALDLLRDSASQGALQKAAIETQGAIDVNSYTEQAGLFNAMADAADNEKKADQFGALLKGGFAAGTNLISVGTTLLGAKALKSLF